MVRAAARGVQQPPLLLPLGLRPGGRQLARGAFFSAGASNCSVVAALQRAAAREASAEAQRVQRRVREARKREARAAAAGALQRLAEQRVAPLAPERPAARQLARSRRPPAELAASRAVPGTSPPAGTPAGPARRKRAVSVAPPRSVAPRLQASPRSALPRPAPLADEPPQVDAAWAPPHAADDLDDELRPPELPSTPEAELLRLLTGGARVADVFTGDGVLLDATLRALPGSVPVLACEKDAGQRRRLTERYPDMLVVDDVVKLEKGLPVKCDVLTMGPPCQVRPTQP